MAARDSSARLAVALTAAAMLLPLALVNGVRPAPRVAPLWDWLMAAGYLALGLMAVLAPLTARYSRRAGASVLATQLVHRLHRDLGYIVLALVACHALGLLLLDATLIEYLKPTAPAGMLAGLAAALALLVLSVLAARRHRGPQRQRPGPRWRRQHRLLAAVVLVLALWHVIASGYYTASAAAAIALALWLLLPALAAARLARQRPDAGAPGRGRQWLAGKAELRRRGLRSTLAVLALALLAMLLFTLPWPPGPPPS